MPEINLDSDPLELAETLIGQFVSIMFLGASQFWGPYKLIGVGEGILQLEGSTNQSYYVNMLAVAVLRPEEVSPSAE